MKTGFNIFCIQERQLIINDRHHLKIKKWKKLMQNNRHKKQTSVAI